MKKWYFYLCVGAVVLGMIGCATEGNSTDKTPTPTVEIIEEEPIITQVAIFQKREDKSFKEENSIKKVITKTEGLCEVLEQLEPLESSYQYNSFNRMASSGDSLFCLDESTGVIYFVNQTKDNFLYRIKDGEVALAVAMPVKEIYPYGGSIYFMVDSYNKYELQGMQSGDIYCYTPASGVVELVYAAGSIENSEWHELSVAESGVYFGYRVKVRKGEREGETVYSMNSYQIPFGEIEPVLDEKFMTISGWKDYYFVRNDKGKIALVSRTLDTDGNREELELPLSPYCYCAVEDILYCAEKTSISCTNLETGEITYYDFVEAMKKMEINLEIEQGKRMIRWFTMTEDAIWVVTDYNIYRMDLESGEVTYGALSHNNKLYIINTLYTDGKEIYGAYYERSIVYPSERPVVRLLTDTMDTSGNAKVGIEFLVE